MLSLSYKLVGQSLVVNDCLNSFFSWSHCATVPLCLGPYGSFSVLDMTTYLEVQHKFDYASGSCLPREEGWYPQML